MGGHGYSVHSRLGRLYHDQDINLTWEGDNTMLLQQSTKYILKSSRKLGKGMTFDHNSLYFINDVAHSINLAN
jgi:acyl-CoA oxidase